MKFILALCLLAVAIAAPQQDRVVQILRSDFQAPVDGSFKSEFESEDGIYVAQEGSPGSAGQSNKVGSFRFTLPDGQVAEFRYTADENGYNVESAFLPTPHPLPAHAVEQIRIAEEQRRQGITFE